MPYDWSGTRILQRNISIPAKRYVLGYVDRPVLTDLREWMWSGDAEEIRRVIREMDGLPVTKDEGSFDERARIVWRWVVQNVEYVEDPEAHLKQDFWQFPAETLALRRGDCEDCSFALATMLLAAGISSFCIRVVWGKVKTEAQGTYGGHVWPVYRDEGGVWRILESTLARGSWTGVWPDANDCTKPDALPRYRPEVCLNDKHVWLVSERGPDDVTAYVSRHRRRR